MNYKHGVISLLIVALAAIGVAIAHTSCIYYGTECYQAQMAPRLIIKSSINGTLLAPLATLFVSLLFLICAGYALSSARLIRQLPCLTLDVYTISTLCMLRGLAIFAAIYLAPEIVTQVNVLASGVWFICGVLLMTGHRSVSGSVT